jgi:hypothetical protein
MGEMADVFRELVRVRRAKRKANLERARQNLDGWTQHTSFHWSRELMGSRLDYWPSKGKWRWQGKTMTGVVDEFIVSRLKEV